MNEEPKSCAKRVPPAFPSCVTPASGCSDNGVRVIIQRLPDGSYMLHIQQP